MQAVTAFDNNPPIEYYFEETSNNQGGSDSGWQASTLYYDKGLLPGTQYTYKVRVRDSQNNITVNSVAKNVTTPAGEPGHFIQDADGTVSIEAENYDGLVTSTKTDHYWALDKSVSGYSGSGAMIALPNRRYEIDEKYVPDASPRMDFNVKFNRAGTHYLHIRGYGSDYNNDACHGGINLQGPPALASMAFTPSLAYVWDNHSGDSEIVIPHPGIHKIHVFMREDGTIIDKIVITDTQSVPSGNGPPESNRGGVGRRRHNR
jgi:hypothetical protein